MKARVRLTKKDLFTFLLYHMYMRPLGVIYMVVGALSLAGGIYFLIRHNTSGIFLLLISSVYFVVQPFMLYLKAVQQAKLPVFEKDTCYEFTENGIRVWQDEVDASTLDWRKIRRFVRFGGEYMIYLDDVRANIIPEKDLECPGEELERLVVKMLPKKNRKGIK